MADKIEKLTHTEAPASATYDVVTKDGLPVLKTYRFNNHDEMEIDSPSIERKLIEDGYTAHQKYPQKTFVKPATVAPTPILGESCPKCGNSLVETTTKTGKKLIKCSTSKWDWKTKTNLGCDYTRWVD